MMKNPEQCMNGQSHYPLRFKQIDPGKVEQW